MEETQVTLVGGGIMSLTLAVLLSELNKNININIYERLHEVALESSLAWNNAGTGHQALCELNYTPRVNGEIDITKAIAINQQFEISKEFWSYCVQKGILKNPQSFINNSAHISFVGGQNVEFLEQRFETLSANPFFKNMEFTKDYDEMMTWAPLVMEGRDKDSKFAATRMLSGTDVDFGEITRQFYEYLKSLPNVKIELSSSVENLKKRADGWELEVKNTEYSSVKIKSGLVFLGAGGGSLMLFQKSGIKKVQGYAGFPVLGLWLVCKNRSIISRHNAKVYGKAEAGDPPMSVPHLDTRRIEGDKGLIFGPYAGFSTKFLKYGSHMDFFKSVRLDNIKPMLEVGINNIGLNKYLMKQLFMTFNGRVNKLKFYMPNVDSSDWEMRAAGQRVQVIKKGKDGRGSLEFGTEVLVSEDRSISGLLGASPGASISVQVMLEVIEKCFKGLVGEDYEEKIRTFLPSYKASIEENIMNFNTRRANSAKNLGLDFQPI